MIKKDFNIVIGANIACLLDGKFKHQVFTNDAAGFASFVAWILSLCGDAGPLICMQG